MKEYDVIIVGAGSAGYAAARTASAAGVKVALIEGAREIGGLCILRGCMPTKALLESSRRWHAIREAREFGLRVDPIEPNLRAIMQRKDRLIAEFADYRRAQLEKGAFTFLRGAARFIGTHEIAITTESRTQKIRGRSFIIATGSEISTVPLPGLAEAGYLTSDSSLTLKKLPQSLIVLGGGAIAVEAAQFFQQLDVPTTIIQRSPQLIKDFDPAVGQTLAEALRATGMKVWTETRLIAVQKKGDFKTVIFEHAGKKKRVLAEKILCALGRHPRIGDLNLAVAGVRLQGNAIGVDLGLRTNQPHIFAAGDVTGLYEVVHVAIQQAEIAGWNAAQLVQGKKNLRSIDYRLKASVVFTQPEVASVGQTEREAKAQGLDYLTASYPFNDHGKSMIMGGKYGFVKLIATRPFGELIGAQVIGPHASDLIHELIAVIHYRGTARELAAMPHYHPTLAEIWTYPAEEIAEQLQAEQKVKKRTKVQSKGGRASFLRSHIGHSTLHNLLSPQ